jgi:hypothetical protein
MEQLEASQVVTFDREDSNLYIKIDRRLESVSDEGEFAWALKEAQPKDGVYRFVIRQNEGDMGRLQIASG